MGPEDIKIMVALEAGTRAPRFALAGMDGSTYDLQNSLDKSGLVVAGFFKVSCPVCQLALPFLERIRHSYPNMPIWGISQDDADATEAFAKMYGLNFPMLLDEGLKQTVAYGLTNVPSIFLISKDNDIEITSVGFSKADLEEINRRLAEKAGSQCVPLFTEADNVPDFKPG